MLAMINSAEIKNAMYFVFVSIFNSLWCAGTRSTYVHGRCSTPLRCMVDWGCVVLVFDWGLPIWTAGHYYHEGGYPKDAKGHLGPQAPGCFGCRPCCLTSHESNLLGKLGSCWSSISRFLLLFWVVFTHVGIILWCRSIQRRDQQCTSCGTIFSLRVWTGMGSIVGGWPTQIVFNLWREGPSEPGTSVCFPRSLTRWKGV